MPHACVISPPFKGRAVAAAVLFGIQTIFASKGGSSGGGGGGGSSGAWTNTVWTVVLPSPRKILHAGVITGLRIFRHIPTLLISERYGPRRRRIRPCFQPGKETFARGGGGDGCAAA